MLGACVEIQHIIHVEGVDVDRDDCVWVYVQIHVCYNYEMNVTLVSGILFY